MKIGKILSLFSMSALLLVLLAACGGDSGSGTAQSTPTAAAPTSTPTADLANSIPTGIPTGIPTSLASGNGCTTAESCQKAIVVAVPDKVRPGGKVVVTGTGWIANAKMEVSIGVQAVDSTIEHPTSDAHGNFTVTLTIDPKTPDLGPTNIHISQVGAGNDGKSLNVQNKLTIVNY